MSCLCVIVDGISHRYNLLTKILTTCCSKFYGLDIKWRILFEHFCLADNLKQARSSMENSNCLGRPEATIAKTLLICGSLCQNFDFDSKGEQVGTLDFLEKVSADQNNRSNFWDQDLT